LETLSSKPLLLIQYKFSRVVDGEVVEDIEGSVVSLDLQHATGLPKRRRIQFHARLPQNKESSPEKAGDDNLLEPKTAGFVHRWRRTDENDASLREKPSGSSPGSPG
jgi:hypothetical protein